MGLAVTADSTSERRKVGTQVKSSRLNLSTPRGSLHLLGRFRPPLTAADGGRRAGGQHIRAHAGMRQPVAGQRAVGIGGRAAIDQHDAHRLGSVVGGIGDGDAAEGRDGTVQRHRLAGCGAGDGGLVVGGGARCHGIDRQDPFGRDENSGDVGARRYKEVDLSALAPHSNGAEISDVDNLPCRTLAVRADRLAVRGAGRSV